MSDDHGLPRRGPSLSINLTRANHARLYDLIVPAMLSHPHPFCEPDVEEAGMSQSTMNLQEAQASQR